MNDELLYTLALTRCLPMNATLQNCLLDEAGSACALYGQRHDVRALLPTATDRLQQALATLDSFLPRAEEELYWAQQNRIRCLLRSDADYPVRLRSCKDRPVVLFYRGTADLNARRILSVVGTRHCTDYGRSVCCQLLRDLADLLPGTLVVSGLAYGIDIQAHRQALDTGLSTVAVLAHGLDQIYPRVHRDTAIRMVAEGGLLTEFMSRSKADKVNFVSRNRIVAGMADATLVVESKAKGGSLITARLAADYGREVFAVPGRWGDELSAGCNNLIARNEATLLQDMEQLAAQLGWPTQAERRQPVQRTLFPQLSAEEQAVVERLDACPEGKDANQLSLETSLPVPVLSPLLFALEMRGILRGRSGGRYALF